MAGITHTRIPHFGSRFCPFPSASLGLLLANGDDVPGFTSYADCVCDRGSTCAICTLETVFFGVTFQGLCHSSEVEAHFIHHTL